VHLPFTQLIEKLPPPSLSVAVFSHVTVSLPLQLCVIDCLVLVDDFLRANRMIKTLKDLQKLVQSNIVE
jgi:hypothetical protein